MKTHFTTGAIGLVLIGTTTVAFAQPPAERGERRPDRGDRPPLSTVIANADTDGDGNVTLDNLQAVDPNFPEHLFNRLDKNTDGFLSADEIPARRAQDGEGFGAPRRGEGPEGGERERGPRGMEKHREGMEKMRAADVNGDRQISQEEFAAAFPDAPADRFSKMDRNADGVLTPDDRPDGPPPQQRDGKRSEGDRGPQDLRAKLREADVNEDRQISLSEFAMAFPDASAERFTKMDRNSDGVLSPEDRPDDEAQRGPRGPEGRAGNKGGYHKHLIEDADSNADGQVSYEEMSAAKPGFPQEAFDRLDKNSDGVLSADDRPERGSGERPKRGGHAPRGGDEEGHRPGPPPHRQ